MNQDIEILRYLAKKDKRIEKLYNKLIYQLSKVSLNITKIREGAFFSFSDYPELKEKVDEILNSYSAEQQKEILDGIRDSVKLSFKANAAVLSEFTRYSDKGLREMRDNAANAFISNRMKPEQGLSLSQKVWNYTRQAKAEFEAGMSEVLEEGLKQGISAEELGRQVRDKLKVPEMVYRRYHTKKITSKGKKDVIEWRRKVIDSEGKVRYVKEDLEKVGRGVYRSSRKNALRLTATEINMAYRYADNVRWMSEPFVIGFRIQLSGNHTCNGKPFYDMCDELVGDYPKTFRWVGWHPRCYSSDSEVLTNRGWQLFKDISDNDLILSLNPDTRNVEWTTIEQQMSWYHKGDMVHFHNRSLDCLVTPEHEMVYIAKGSGKIQRKDAAEFRMTQGAFYRSCEYMANDIDIIKIGDTVLQFDLFCEFMGYWLSDGSTIRTVQIVIAQKDDDPNKQRIVECIERMGFRTHTNADRVEFYSKDLCQYLKQFGKCDEKYIPQPVKDASKRQIQIFLDSFISCDGYIKKPHSFVGSRGNVCVAQNSERLYFTTSKQLASDLGELILKIGKRPSYHINKKAGSVSHFGNGAYASNYDCYSISECQGATATVFEKDVVAYDDMVYDLELTKNHIMYIRRNGKCFWGSNCRCIATPLLVSKEEMLKIASLPEEEYKRYRSPNLITKMPQNYDAYVETNRDRIFAAMDRGTLPYWVRDNYKDGDIDKGLYWTGRRVKTEEHKKAIQAAWDERRRKNAIKLAAQKRHANRDAKAIQEAWDKRKRRNAILVAAEKRHTARDAVAIQKAWDERKERYAKIKKIAGNVYMASLDYPWVDTTILEFLATRNKYHLLEDEYRKVAKRIAEVKRQQAELSKLIPNIRDWQHEFVYNELKVVYDSVQKTLNRWAWDLSSETSLESIRKGLEYEIKWMSTKGTKYVTWEVAVDAYKSKLSFINNRIQLLNVKNSIKNELLLLSSSKSKNGKLLAKEFDDLFNKEDASLSSLQAKAREVSDKAKQIQQQRKSQLASKSSTASGFIPKSKDETINEFKQWMSSIGIDVPDWMIDYDKGFIQLSYNQHQQIYDALKPETVQEHIQLWNHKNLSKGARWGAAGYVRTGNSFKINGDFRETGVVGMLDNKAIATLKAHGMNDDDEITVKLLDKKISEFSVPIPLRVTRYVEPKALSNIFGETIETNRQLYWFSPEKTIESIENSRKVIQADPAFLSASTNEAKNVFTHFDIKLEIEVPPNTPFYLTNNYAESEVVFGRSTNLQFISAKKKGSGVVIRARIKP